MWFISHTLLQMQPTCNITISPDVPRPAPARGWLALIGSVIDKIGKLEDWEIAWPRLTDTRGQLVTSIMWCQMSRSLVTRDPGQGVAPVLSSSLATCPVTCDMESVSWGRIPGHCELMTPLSAIGCLWHSHIALSRIITVMLAALCNHAVTDGIIRLQ